jgi:hypothetical protein
MAFVRWLCAGHRIGFWAAVAVEIMYIKGVFMANLLHATQLLKRHKASWLLRNLLAMVKCGRSISSERYFEKKSTQKILCFAVAKNLSQP